MDIQAIWAEHSPALFDLAGNLAIALLILVVGYWIAGRVSKH